MCDETPEERQKNEFEALQAIFLDSVEDNRETTAWNIWRPNDFQLTLYPMHNSNVKGVHCSVTLHIKCDHNYPDVPPAIGIIKTQGLSTENSEKLLSELFHLASEQCGEVMIYNLAQHAQVV